MCDDDEVEWREFKVMMRISDIDNRQYDVANIWDFSDGDYIDNTFIITTSDKFIVL